MQHNQFSFDMKPFEFEVEPFDFDEEYEGEWTGFQEEGQDAEWEAEIARRRGGRRHPTRRIRAHRPVLRGAGKRTPRGYRSRRYRRAPFPGRPTRPPRPSPFPQRPLPFPTYTVIRDRPIREPDQGDSRPPREPAREPTNGSSSGSAGLQDVNQEPSPGGSEYVRWVQSSLNQILGLNLPLDGVIGVETRSAVRSFQEKQGLPADGIVGPGTERALQAARKGPGKAVGHGQAPAKPPTTQEGAPATGAAGQEEGFFDNIKDFFTRKRIIDLTAQADKSKRKGSRDPKSVYALVLHQMACCYKRKDPLKSYLRLSAHFAILPDGKILQLHPISALVWASNGFNKRSVAVEFAGNFPNTKGRWWKGDTYGRNRVTPAQIEAGRYLVRYLIRTMGLTHILAHRQSSATRENDPGPDIWYNVGQWAIDKYGLKDGGPGFKVGGGNPIPDLWRIWGRTKPQPELSEEIDPESPEHERWLQQALNRTLGLRLPPADAGGPAMRSALRSFQHQHGLPVDGELTEEVEALLIAEGAPPHRHPASP